MESGHVLNLDHPHEHQGLMYQWIITGYGCVQIPILSRSNNIDACFVICYWLTYKNGLIGTLKTWGLVYKTCIRLDLIPNIRQT